MSDGSTTAEDLQVWRPGWPGGTTTRIRFPDGVAFYNNVDNGRWAGMNMAGQFMSSETGNFDDHPGHFDAIFVAFHTMTLEDVVRLIGVRYGSSVRPVFEYRQIDQPTTSRSTR